MSTLLKILKLFFLEMGWNIPNPNKIFRARKTISRCFKQNRFSFRRMKKIFLKYTKFSKHSTAISATSIALDIWF
jgi:triacylglycerol esterase/lipase EstA (alpha/beta hydrolase family)